MAATMAGLMAATKVAETAEMMDARTAALTGSTLADHWDDRWAARSGAMTAVCWEPRWADQMGDQKVDKTAETMAAMRVDQRGCLTAGLKDHSKAGAMDASSVVSKAGR